MQRRFRFAINNRCTYGFVHSSAEALQQVLWMRGELAVPRAIWPYISNKPLDEAVPETYAPDAVVVEISSIKKIVYRDFILQLNRMSEVYADVPELLTVWRRFSSHPMLADRHRALEACESFGALDDARRAVLTESAIELQTVESIRADLAALVPLLPRAALYVTHCEADTEDGLPLRARAEAIRRVSTALEAEGLRWFDPSPDMQAFGQANGFSQAGRDTSHYTDGFSTRVGERFCGQLWPKVARTFDSRIRDFARFG